MAKTLFITNDDGYHAPGIQLLCEALSGLGEIFVAAPAHEQSASSHSLTVRKRIATSRVREGHYKIEGTPTDSVLLGIQGILKRTPDLLVSGINHGPNMGEDVTYSGTVAAAIEGTLIGVPSVAISSLQRDIKSTDTIGRIARVVVEAALKLGMPDGSLLNVNIPDPDISPIKGVRITKLGSRAYDNPLQPEEEEDDVVYYTIGGNDPVWQADDGTDIAAVRMGYVSVTPLQLDLTDYKAIVEMEQWRFEL
ncbi:MAG: 5'/3'-nucleotidase SurE [Candidatus Latescibacterota bacterium]|nr:MAG: 5'/3'-nucleotidase SurE [Candidatus Latescibacterota bacterium]